MSVAGSLGKLPQATWAHDRAAIDKRPLQTAARRVAASAYWATLA